MNAFDALFCHAPSELLIQFFGAEIRLFHICYFSQTGCCQFKEHLTFVGCADTSFDKPHFFNGIDDFRNA